MDLEPKPASVAENVHLWSLLREHAAWVNQEKQIIWRRFAASLTAVSIILPASILTFDRMPVSAELALAILGFFVCVLWLSQSICGWNFQDKRLEIIAEIQGQIDPESLKKWPLAERPGTEQRADWIKWFSLSIIMLFMLSFVEIGRASCRERV